MFNESHREPLVFIKVVLCKELRADNIVSKNVRYRTNVFESPTKTIFATFAVSIISQEENDVVIHALRFKKYTFIFVNEKITDDKRHPMFWVRRAQFSSRKSFQRVSEIWRPQRWVEWPVWRDQIANTSWGGGIAEQLPPGHQLAWRTWRTVNSIWAVDVGER